MSEIEELWAKADAALAEAIEMPWGSKRIEALKTAGLLRNRAVQKEIALGKTGEPVHHQRRRFGRHPLFPMVLPAANKTNGKDWE